MTKLPQVSEHSENEINVTMKTSKGDIKFRLFPDRAPKAVENFVGLAKKGYYNGIIFHRVINNFMIQGGDPTGTGMGGASIWDKSFEDEFNNGLFNIHGALSMANAGPNTNGSQFFIVTANNVPNDMLSQLKDGGWPAEIIDVYAKQGGTPWLDNRHTVFGQVDSGLDVAYAIQDVEKNAADKPLEDVVLEEVIVEG
ncbi:peptidylprolyl isomerase [Jeotgalibaca sp. MA1X17-3]|uniref:peptidylprolyl isomerase n=1 Tax=Jeotgalibaca sp. MA1X17-3 TaxID=2908211 RepID=UPI001F25FB02|nr:peptidylprolyl isomerase [Jeotgalibaca sp. MA1X17-3]UJF14627.1 peptidylprolyl isomerase [Jeotgalibaca sp. MA1X17-3]